MSTSPKEAATPKDTVCLQKYGEPNSKPVCTNEKAPPKDINAPPESTVKPPSKLEQIYRNFKEFRALGTKAEATEGPAGAPHTPAKNAGAQPRTYQPER